MLEHEGQPITDPDEIIDIMQKWYERTAERIVPMTEAISDFLLRHNQTLPQIDEDRKSRLEEEFSF